MNLKKIKNFKAQINAKEHMNIKLNAINFQNSIILWTLLSI